MDDTALSLAVDTDPAGHRGAMAEQWDALGQLQLDLLIAAGLRPTHRLLDLGCGPLRAGVKIIPYLDPQNYYGVDRNKQLLERGHALELGPLGLKIRCPRENLFHSGQFQHGRLDRQSIDYGLCISVLPHNPLNAIRVLLEKTGKFFKKGGQLLVSYLELPDGRKFGRLHTNMSRFESFGHKAPFHAYRRDLTEAAAAAGWSAEPRGGFGHPNGESLMLYVRL